MRKEFEEAKERFYKKQTEEYYKKLHGRIIKGYCSCCGAIVETNGECYHDNECIQSKIKMPL